jgi:hypothetical protein
MALLGVQKVNDISSALKNKNKKYKTAMKSEHLVEKLSALVMDITPPDTFGKGKKPTIPEVWRWIRKFFEEYMKIRKVGNQETETREMLQKLMICLELRYPEDVHLLKEKLERFSVI